MGEHAFNTLTKKPSLQTWTRQVYLCGSSKPLHILGELPVELSYEGQFCKTVVHVVKEDSHPLATLLSHVSATALDFLHIVYPLSTPDSLQGYPELVNGIGKLKGMCVHLHINPNLPPVGQKPLRELFHM